MTKGFADLLEIGDQTRPDLFDLSISTKPSLLYRREDVIEASERVTPEGWTLDPVEQTVEGLLARAKESDEQGTLAVGMSGEVVRIIEELGMFTWLPNRILALTVRSYPDESMLEQDLRELFDRGLRSLAVCLLHSWTYPRM